MRRGTLTSLLLLAVVLLLAVMLTPTEARGTYPEIGRSNRAVALAFGEGGSNRKVAGGRTSGLTSTPNGPTNNTDPPSHATTVLRVLQSGDGDNVGQDNGRQRGGRWWLLRGQPAGPAGADKQSGDGDNTGKEYDEGDH